MTVTTTVAVGDVTTGAYITDCMADLAGMLWRSRRLLTHIDNISTLRQSDELVLLENLQSSTAVPTQPKNHPDHAKAFIQPMISGTSNGYVFAKMSNSVVTYMYVMCCQPPHYSG